jgi:hypothetical protein
MKINRVIKNGHEIIYGTGTHEEIESLNIAKDFESALNILGKIRDTRRGLFGSNETQRVNRCTYGRRKTR